VGYRVTSRSRVLHIVRIVLLSSAALLAALGIPIMVRSSHRLGQRGEVVLDADEPDDGADPSEA
jgi:hypothetical protein